MSYEQGEGKIAILMTHFPKEMREDSKYDIIKIVVDIADPYELTNGEIEKIFKKCFSILTGECDTSALAKEIDSYLSEDHKEFSQKVSDALLDNVITPIKNALGDKFPIDMNKTGNNEDLDRESILSGIENPVKSKERSSMSDPYIDSQPRSTSNRQTESNHKEIEIRPEMIPEEIYPEIQKVEKGLPKQEEKPRVVGSIVEQKMSGSVSLPKVEKTIKPSVKPYTVDPYREALK